MLAGAVASVVSGVPSTTYHLVTRRSVLDPVRAAGTLVLPAAAPGPLLLVAGTVVHVAVSLGWGAVLGVVLPRRRSAGWGVAAGLVIAGLDLGVLGRRFPRIRALEPAPQVADHLAYGATVGAALRCRAGWRGGATPPHR